MSRKNGKLAKLDFSGKRLSSASGLKGLDACNQPLKVKLSGNAFESVPAEELSMLDLRELDMAKNNIRELTTSLSSLASLELLNLASNRIRMIGEEVLPLTSLRCLDLSSNQLTVVPPVIAQLVSLESLKLAKNLIHIIPTNLIVLTNLQDLDVSGNPLISPPPDVVSKGTSAIMKHLELTSNIIGASVNQFSHLHRQPYISDWIKPIADSLAISRSRPKTLFTRPEPVEPFQGYFYVSHSAYSDQGCREYMEDTYIAINHMTLPYSESKKRRRKLELANAAASGIPITGASTSQLPVHLSSKFTTITMGSSSVSSPRRLPITGISYSQPEGRSRGSAPRPRPSDLLSDRANDDEELYNDDEKDVMSGSTELKIRKQLSSRSPRGSESTSEATEETSSTASTEKRTAKRRSRPKPNQAVEDKDEKKNSSTSSTPNATEEADSNDIQVKSNSETNDSTEPLSENGDQAATTTTPDHGSKNGNGVSKNGSESAKNRIESSEDKILIQQHHHQDSPKSQMITTHISERKSAHSSPNSHHVDQQTGSSVPHRSSPPSSMPAPRLSRGPVAPKSFSASLSSNEPSSASASLPTTSPTCVTSSLPTVRRGSSFHSSSPNVISPRTASAPDGECMALYAVFDGHAGGRCSKFMKDHFAKIFFDLKATRRGEIPIGLFKAFAKAELQFCQVAKSAGWPDGSTGVVAVVHGHHLLVAHVGDSRAVLCRGKKAIELTSDHKPDRADETERILSLGGTVERTETGGSIPRVNGHLAVSRSFGDLRMKEVQRYVSAEPEMTVVPLTPNDKFVVLASDGLWDVLTNQEAVDFVRKDSSKSKAARNLVKRALKIGTTDNITVLVVWLTWVNGGSTPAVAGTSTVTIPINLATNSDEMADGSPDTSLPASPRSEEDAEIDTEGEAEELSNGAPHKDETEPDH